jgi:hypothetical protein
MTMTARNANRGADDCQHGICYGPVCRLDQTDWDLLDEFEGDEEADDWERDWDGTGCEG